MERLLLAAEKHDSDENGGADETEKICTLLDLARSVLSSRALPSDDTSTLTLLYRTLRPLLRTDVHHPRVQKKSYAVLSSLCQHYNSFLLTPPERLVETVDLLVGSVAALHVSARGVRLRCLLNLSQGFDCTEGSEHALSHRDAITNVMGEVLLCLKDANSKTREVAYELLLALTTARDDLTQIVHTVVGALGAQTSHMRSAAVTALSRLVFEYARVDATMRDLLPNLLRTVCVLFDETSREVVKSVVGFVRVSVAAMEKDQLEPLLPELVGGLMKYERGSGRFRAKIKIILKRLVRTYGYEAVGEFVPKSDARLLTHMRKIAERAERRKVAGKQDGDDGGGDDFEGMMEEDEEDSDDGKTFRTGATGFTKMTGIGSRKALTVARTAVDGRSIGGTNKSMKSGRTAASMGGSGGGVRIDTGGELRGEVLDMLDPSANKSVKFIDEDEGEDSDFDDDGEAMEFDDDGKLLVGDDDDDTFGGKTEVSGTSRNRRRKENEGTSNDDDAGDGGRNHKKIRISKFESAKAKREETHRKKSQSKAKRDAARDTPLGAEFRSKKAGGDVTKKNQKFEPYAYVPLDGKSYTKKNRAGTVARMSTVVRSGGGGNKRRRR